jgi:hypothetical protein
MSDRGPANRDVAEEVAMALVGDVDPARLESFGFAGQILPVFRLVRALFSQNEVDTCLKLMLLHELTRTGGRWTIERIRAHARYLDPGRVEGLVRSLKEGEWLDLRDSDHSYALSARGIHLLSVMHAADFGSLSPANALARAAQNASFGATLDGADPNAVSYLLEQLLVLLEDQLDEARTVLQHGRPHRLIDWSRREHRRQLETIQNVLSTLQERLDASSRAFREVVRLHEAMQEIVRLHTGIHHRLREWNLDRLYAADAGYSIPELLEAVLGAEDTVLEQTIADGILQAPQLPPTLTFAELKERIHGARRKLPSQSEAYMYSPPPEVNSQPLTAADLDPAGVLRSHFSRLFASRTAADPPIEIEMWTGNEGISETSWEFALVSRLQEGAGAFALDDGRQVEIVLEIPIPRGIGARDLLAWLVEREALRRVPAGWFARLRLRLTATEAGAATEGVG